MSGSSGTALIISVIMIAVTVLAPIPEFVFAGTDGACSSDTCWSESIPQMLEAGDYREGVVFAGIDTRKVDDISDVSKDAEEVMAVDASAVKDASTGASTAEQDDCISITCIQRDDMTTEQILRMLAKDDSVIFAEPDYIIEEQAAEATKMAETVKEISGNIGSADSISDLTPLQWSSSDKASLHAEGSYGGVSINVPNFGKDGSNMEGDPVVIAVIDQPIDFSNPDLKDVAYSFTKEAQEVLGCDVHGYNSTWQSEDGKLVYWNNSNHGTHCAGIIGASWDGHGISGVASNVRLISVQNCLDDGKTSLINVLRGMAFIKKANELGANVRITSNSWGLLQNSMALDAAVRELGEKQGVISVFAAGNDYIDLAGTDYVSTALQSNPYAIIVAATDPAGNLSGFSDYSDNIVTMGAPGSGILSSVQACNGIYMPDAVRDTNIIYEGFESGQESPVKISQADYESMESVETDHEICGREGMGFAGEHALRIGLDMTYGKKWWLGNSFLIRMDLGNLSEKGVKAGDYLGFAYGQVDFGEFADCWYYDRVKNEWKSVEYNCDAAESDCFGNFSLAIPEDADLSDLSLCFEFLAGESSKSIYLDSVGIGTQTVPYRILSGTSMACPAVSGGAAVIASRYPEARGEELVKLVKSSVRKMPSLYGKTQTGGILDLSVDVGSESPEAGPVITSASVKGKTVTLNGSHFGIKAGTAAIKKMTPGTAGEKQSASVSSWSDSKVVLKLKKDFKGIAQVSIMAKASGKTDLYTWFVSKSDWVYGQDLPFDKETGKPFDFDAGGDMEAGGLFQAIGGKLYYLPTVTKVEVEPANKALMAYDTAAEKWTSCADLPVWMENTSSAVHDGKLIVKGDVMEEKENIPYSAKDPDIAVYAYDPATDTWASCSAADVFHEDTIISDGDELLLVGCAKRDKNSDVVSIVRKYDIASGAGKIVAELLNKFVNPQAAVSDGVLYIYDIEQYILESVGLKGGTVRWDKVLSLPFYDGQQNPPPYENRVDQSRKNAALVPVYGGILFIGPAAADGSSDTFLLKTGTDRFTACPRRVSEDNLQTLTAAASGGRIYVIGSSVLESGGRLFRSETFKNITKKLGNPMSASGRTVTIKAKKLKKKAAKVSAAKAYKISGPCGKVTYKKVKLNKKKYSKKFVVDPSSGRITVKKGVKKGKYKLTVKVRAGGDRHYAAKIKNVKVTIRVK